MIGKIVQIREGELEVELIIKIMKPLRPYKPDNPGEEARKEYEREQKTYLKEMDEYYNFRLGPIEVRSVPRKRVIQ